MELREIELYVLSNVDTDESSFLSVAFREHMITRLILANVLSYMNAKSWFLSNLTFWVFRYTCPFPERFL